MNGFFDGIATIYAYLATAPFAIFLLVWGGGYAVVRDSRQSFRWGMDATTFFLVGSVAAMYNRSFGTSGGIWLMVLLLLIGAGLIGSAQMKLKGEVDWQRTTRAVWRISFFLLSFLYLIFLFSGIVRSIGNT